MLTVCDATEVWTYIPIGPVQYHLRCTCCCFSDGCTQLSNLRNIDNKLSKTQTSHISLLCIPESAFAGLHIRTNNLESRVWEKDEKDFVQLILSVKEKSISSDYIFVCLILRRWDSRALHEQSIYYNKKLIELSPLYNLKMFYSDNTFILSDKCYASNGLKQGKNLYLFFGGYFSSLPA